MNAGPFIALGLATSMWLASAGDDPRLGSTGKESRMTTRATGTFDVKLTPLASDDEDGTSLGRGAQDLAIAVVPDSGVVRRGRTGPGTATGSASSTSSHDSRPAGPQLSAS